MVKSSMKKAEESSSDDASHWKSAVDPRTGRTYYYHEVTRETQWRKPMELASDEEKRAMEEKEKKQKDFFAAMEANILNSLSQGVVPGGGSDTANNNTNPSSSSDNAAAAFRSFGRRKSSRKVSIGPDGRPDLVRTISTMDETILMDVIRRQPSIRNVTQGLSREESLQPGDLMLPRRKTSEIRDGFESWSQSSHNQPLETLEEAEAEWNDSRMQSLPKLYSFVSDGLGGFEDDDEEGGPKSSGDNDFDKSSLTGFGLSWEETQALKKLASITQEMIDSEDDDTALDQEESPSGLKGTKAGATPAGIGKGKRDLPRELDFDDSDDEGKETPKQLPALNKAREGSDGRALPREIDLDFDSSDEEESEHGGGAKKGEEEMSRPEVKRRNTCGTMYIGTTMSAPDKDATIRVRYDERNFSKKVIQLPYLQHTHFCLLF